MKKFLVLFVLTFTLGLFLTETAHAQPPIDVTKKTATKSASASQVSNSFQRGSDGPFVSDADTKVLNTFEPIEETKTYLENRKPVKTCATAPKNKLLEEVAYENPNFVYLPSIKDASPDGMYASYQKVDHAMAHQWIRVINGTLTAIRLEIGFDQNVISVWKKDTDPDALGQLPDYQIPAAKKIWDVQTLETDFAFIIFYKTLNDNGDVEIIEVDIP